MFADSLQLQLKQLRERLRGDFRPDGLLAIAKPKTSGGNRIICVPTIADRLLQFSLLVQLRPRLKAMKLDNEVSYGIAPGLERSVEGARNFACGARQQHPWVYKADIHQFFDNIGRDLLRTALKARLKQPSLSPILHKFLDAEISDGLDRDWQEKVGAAGIQRGRGVRQGMPLSPLFAGSYLCGVDQLLIKTGVPVARYVDDIVAFFDTEAECEAFHLQLRTMLEDVGLTIGDLGEDGSKTCVYAPDESAVFLGMEIVQQNNKRYSLCVPNRVMDEIAGRFAEASSVSSLLARRVGLTNMGRYFDSVVCGYVQAYRAAQNIGELEAMLTELSRSSQETILITLFGDRLRCLSPEELRFVGVASSVLDAGTLTTQSARKRSRASGRRVQTRQ